MGAFEYLHIFIDTAESAEQGDDYGLSALVEEKLNWLGQQEWELVNMTPDWAWRHETTWVTQTHEYQAASEFGPYAQPATYQVDAPYSYSFPSYVQGWHCTFNRLHS